LRALRLRTIQTCRRHYPGGTAGGDDRSIPAAVTAFTAQSRLGSRINNFEACSAFTHVTACLFARSPEATPCTEGLGSFVTSTAAPIATGRSDPVAGRDLHPQALSAFARRTSRRVSRGEPSCVERTNVTQELPANAERKPSRRLAFFAFFREDFRSSLSGPSLSVLGESHRRSRGTFKVPLVARKPLPKLSESLVTIPRGVTTPVSLELPCGASNSPYPATDVQV
jgi:hypothetical protein